MIYFLCELEVILNNKNYYKKYEDRYKAVYEAGIDLWGNSRDDNKLYNDIRAWVENNNLTGKRIVEFACGEGEVGIILSELGCIFMGMI